MSFLKEASQKCIVFEIQSFIFQGSLAEMLRFELQSFIVLRKSRRNASFLIFKASFFEGSLAQKLRFSASKRAF